MRFHEISDPFSKRLVGTLASQQVESWCFKSRCLSGGRSKFCLGKEGLQVLVSTGAVQRNVEAMKKVSCAA
jgi:hypothetical protein